MARPRIEVGLEAGHEPAAVGHEAPSRERGADLGRMVGVVVEDERAARAGAVRLEAPGRAGVRAEGGRGLRDLDARLAAGGDRGQRVQHVVLAGHRKLDHRLAHPEARAERQQLDVARGHVAGADAECHGRLEGEAVRHDPPRSGGDELAEGALELEQRVVGGVVVEVDVRDDRDLGRELQERAIGLVGLGDHPLPLSPGRVRAGRAQLAAHQVCGVAAALDQHVHRHRRGGGLPVGPRDRDAALQPGRFGEQVAAMQHPQPALAREHELGVVLRDRRRHHDLLGAVGQVRRVVADRGLETGLAQALAVRRIGTVRSRDLRAERPCDEGEAAHPGAADADEVEPAAGPLRAAHRIPT